MAQPPTERRTHTRHEYRAPLQFRPSALYSATALDLSERGMTIETAQSVAPGATLAQVISVVQYYNHHQDWYRPEVIRSRLVSHEGNDFKIYYRLRKQKVITVTLDTDHDVHYFPVDATHEYSRSVSTRIQEVANAGEKDEHEKPVGNDGGFLCRAGLGGGGVVPRRGRASGW